MIKNITNFAILTFGVFMIYLGVYGIVYNSSSNMAVENTFMQKVYSDLNFDYDQNSKSRYGNNENDLFNSKWSSSNYPNGDIYNKVNIIFTPKGTEASVGISSSVSTTRINIPRVTRESH